MDIIVKVAAVFCVVLGIIAVIGGPFTIGEPRKNFTATSYLYVLAQAIAMFILAGRAFGLW